MNYTNLLNKHDHPKNWEYPPGFDYKSAQAKFAKFSNELKEAIDSSMKTETGSYIQDASFHSQIFLPLPDGGQTVIRFSNFGDMVTFSEDDVIPDAMTQILRQLFEKYEYQYMPESVLSEPYTGKNSGVTGISTWWVRYFDWV